MRQGTLQEGATRKKERINHNDNKSTNPNTKETETCEKIDKMKLELSFKVKTQHGGVEKEMEGDYTYFDTFLPKHPYSILIYLNWTQLRYETLPERVQQERKRDNNPRGHKKYQKPKNVMKIFIES